MSRRHTYQACRFLQTRQNQDDGQPRGHLLKWAIAQIILNWFESSRHFVVWYPEENQSKDSSDLLWKEPNQPILLGKVVTQLEATRSSSHCALVSMMSFVKSGIWCSWNEPTILTDGGVNTTVFVLLRRLRWGVSEDEEATSPMDP